MPGARSIAARLTIWYAASAFALSMGVTGYLYWTLADHLEREDREILLDQLRILRAILRERPADPAALAQEVEWETEAREHNRLFVRILDEKGGKVAETPGFPRELPASAFPPPAGNDAEPDSTPGPDSPSRKAFRLICAGAKVGKGGIEPGQSAAVEAMPQEQGAAASGSRAVQIALDRSEKESILSGFRWQALSALAASLFLSALLGHRIARRGIRPVEEIASTARAIRPGTLGRRIESAGLPAEIAALAVTFNGMLERLEESFGRLGRFSADIAHELRTPLSNLRGEIEVALGKPRSGNEYREVLGSCLEECERLARMVERLLFLARAEDPATRVARESVELGKELDAIREFYQAAAAEKGIDLTVEVGRPSDGAVDRSLFQRALGNLVENALAHTGRGGRVVLAASRINGAVRASVSDTGCGIPPGQLPRVFERFFRADPSRTTATGGTGLGLAIVKGIAELHGGRVEIASELGRGTRVELYFPV